MSLAPSTVSEQIKKLEEGHGLKLFHRKSRELVLTEDGEKVFSYANEMFERGKRLEDHLIHDDVSGYTVKIGMEPAIESSKILEFLSVYWKSYSQFGLVETKRSKNLSQSIYFLEHDVVDWFITSSAFSDERFGVTEIAKYKYSFYCSDKLYKRKKDKKEIIRNLPLGKLGVDETIDNEVKSFLLDKGVSPKESFSSDHSQLLYSLCEQGQISMLLPDMESGYQGLKKIDLGETFDIKIYAVYKKSNAQLLYMRKLFELISIFSPRPDTFVDHSDFLPKGSIRSVENLSFS
jgi:DNA-binding transcriptional LysR family regulator